MGSHDRGIILGRKMPAKCSLDVADSILRSHGAVRSETSICAPIALMAAAAPTEVAIVDGARTMTYGQLERESNRLARHLADVAHEAGPDGCVGLLLDRSAAFVVAALAVMKSGAAYLP